MSDGYDSTWAAGSTVIGRRKNNWAAVVDPGVTDDSSEGYEIGSRWANTVGETVWDCVDATEGVAVWKNASAGGSSDYQHTQAVAALTWTINHNLGRYPAVTVLDSASTQIETSVEHTSLNQVVLTLSNATSGVATCS